MTLFIGILYDKLSSMIIFKSSRLWVLFFVVNIYRVGYAKEFVPMDNYDKRPREELMVVQTVSKDRHSFVVTKGIKEGIFKGQEIIFANQNISILCKAQEVNRNYSLWIPAGDNVSIPFNKEEIISFNSYTYGNVSLDLIGDRNNLNQNFIDYDQIYKKFRINNNISAKLSLNRGLAQSSSDVSVGNNSNRTGNSFIVEYNYRFMPQFELNFGGRIDNEVYQLTNPVLDIPTSRTMATIAATYHLMNFTSNQNNFYLTMAAGIGTSKTIINDVVSSGSATLLPEARIGFISPASTSLAMVYEASIESITAKEKVNDESEQVTNMLNVKFTIGIRF